VYRKRESSSSTSSRVVENLFAFDEVHVFEVDKTSALRKSV